MKRLLGAGVKSLHFSTVEELLFSFYVMFLFFGQTPCHLCHCEDDPEDEQISSGRGEGEGGH